MRKRKEIIITISPKGETKIEAKGFQGRNCLRATQPFEEALGGKVSERKMKRPVEIQKERQSLGN